MAFCGLTMSYNNVTKNITMKVNKSITINPFSDIGVSSFGNGLGVGTSASHSVSDANAFIISSTEKTTWHSSCTINGSTHGYYYTYTLTALKKGTYTFKGYVSYISSTGDYGSFYTSTATATYIITVTDTDLNPLVPDYSTIMASGVSLNHSSYELQKDGMVKLSATVTPSNTTNKSVSWTSSNPSVAVVASDGTVTGLQSGSCSITATTVDGSNKSATCAVRVYDVTSISIPSSLSLKKGDAYTFSPVIVDNNATTTLRWTSTNTSVAIINSSGILTAKSVGTATVICTAHNGVYVQCEVTVRENRIPATDISLSTISAEIETGEVMQLTAIVSPDDATNKSVTWSSDNPNVALVHSNGLVTAVGAGTCNIVARTTDGTNLSETCYVQVHEGAGARQSMKVWRNGECELYKVYAVDSVSFACLVSDIYLSEETLQMEVGETKKLTATVYPIDAEERAVAWESSNTSIATVDQTGKVTTVAAGSCTITAKATDGSGVKTRCQLMVGNVISVSEIVLSETSLTLGVDETKTLNADVLPADADNKEVTWESSNEDVAEVNAKGRVMANDEGTCIITCRAMDGSGVYAECEVTVTGGGSNPAVLANPLDGHEWVDLGLPSGTLWATCNVGADSPEDNGDYFAWGEIEPNDAYENRYSWDRYKYGTESNITKYNAVDGKTELEAGDDAATNNWSSNWQIPSLIQCQELIDTTFTTSIKTFQNNGKVAGYLITSKINGNSIFLPSAGIYANGGTYYLMGGVYFSSTLDTDSNNDLTYCRVIGFKDAHLVPSSFQTGIYSTIGIGSVLRYCGMSVRPVVKVLSGTTPTPGLVTKIELSETSLTLQIGQTDTLTATVLPENAANKTVTWESSNVAVCTVNNDGKVTAIGNGSCYVVCHATDDSGVSAYCKVTVGNTTNSEEHEWVDLGLPSGTLWATCNVGGSCPEDYGDYFAWGETEPKFDYTWDTYMYYNTSYGTITKYCTNSSRGAIDNLTELKPEDDAATVNWGSDWQMPSIEQMKELLNTNYTTRSWTTMNGVKGRMIVSKSNGNRIFLPAAGLCDGTSITKAGSAGRYWTRSLNEEDSRYGRRMSFDSDGIDMGIYLRYRGRSVRPVRKQ